MTTLTSEEVRSYRALLPAELASIDDQNLEALVMATRSQLSPEEMENFWRSIGKGFKTAGKFLKNNAGTILPVVGGVAGTIIGGPAGAKIGSGIGNVAGKLISGKSATPATNRLGNVISNPRVQAVLAPRTVAPVAQTAFRNSNGMAINVTIADLVRTIALLSKLSIRELDRRTRRGSSRESYESAETALNSLHPSAVSIIELIEQDERFERSMEFITEVLEANNDTYSNEDAIEESFDFAAPQL